MRKLVLKIIHPFFRRFTRYYFKRPRVYKYKSLRGMVNPGVFHPQFTHSTKILLDYLDGQPLQGKQLLELGCGTGIISAYASKKGARAIASDINPLALNNAALNATNNDVSVELIRSDLFDEIPLQVFDFIVINPPYYAKNPKNDIEKAWYCGENLEYFEKLFSTILPYFDSTSKVILVLSEDCEIERIKKIAAKNLLQWHELLKLKKYGEWSHLFSLRNSS